ncbi:hypothetical protein HMPREF0766_13345 [Sphingobacterium spiritivorum ATCC 33861]|uniref:Uncharacterized protein n=1 Tax=Sphingobacterium spiritivorum ATCC 33861 TaxID=525373 RepID=D7VQU1_SPHSI|nr:hypothetical protein HMPREF0766_13345 [Sphingobacterium spiritivorum ATCC 33861]
MWFPFSDHRSPASDFPEIALSGYSLLISPFFITMKNSNTVSIVVTVCYISCGLKK